MKPIPPYLTALANWHTVCQFLIHQSPDSKTLRAMYAYEAGHKNRQPIKKKILARYGRLCKEELEEKHV